MFYTFSHFKIYFFTIKLKYKQLNNSIYIFKMSLVTKEIQKEEKVNSDKKESIDHIKVINGALNETQTDINNRYFKSVKLLTCYGKKGSYILRSSL